MFRLFGVLSACFPKPWARKQKCVGGFSFLYKFWRIFPGIFLEDFLGTVSHQKNEEKKSGEKIREKNPAAQK